MCGAWRQSITIISICRSCGFSDKLLDGLVNNAGVVATQPFEASDEALFDWVYAVNIRGGFFCAQHALPHLQARGAAARAAGRRWAGGSIVNISSVHGQAGFSGHAVYAGTKGAVNAWTAVAVSVSTKKTALRPVR